MDPNKVFSLVVLTGGEPFRQNIRPLVGQLLLSGYKVQIETNGTAVGEGFPWSKVTIVCSPKTPEINPSLKVDYFKYVLDAEHVDELDGLPTSVLGMNLKPARPKPELHHGIPVYVQPADEGDEVKNAANVDAAIKSCFTHGYLLCLQIHKYLGLP